ncbi:hypothetical protein DCD76_18215, partial [Acinetobacter baumannii]|uniref:hypothetical protein n=1 Tax=Acinetobacter baumannii TaxID=470 RepID=UPI000DE7435A
EPSLVIFAGADYKHPDGAYQYFHAKYPEDTIYESNSLTDLKSLRPDYVFITSPYEGRRPFPSYRVNDIVQFAKVCTVMYGANLNYSFTDRLFDDYPHFWRNVYLPFVSAPTAKTMLEEKFPALHDYQHVEFFGYPVLKTYYNMESEPSPAKRILWT